MMISLIMMMILFDQVGISLEGIILGHYDDYDDDYSDYDAGTMDQVLISLGGIILGHYAIMLMIISVIMMMILFD